MHGDLYCRDVFANEISLLSLFTAKVVRDPINQHVRRGCERRRVRPHGSHTDAALFLFIHLLSTIRSRLSSNSPQHKGMNFLMRSNMSYIGSELLIYFCMASTMSFPKRMGLYKFPPDVRFATSLDVFLACLSRMNAGLLACWRIFWILIHIFL